MPVESIVSILYDYGGIFELRVSRLCGIAIWIERSRE